jgi:hypothetical protein
VFIAPADGIFLVRLFAFSSTPSTNIRYAGGDKFIYRLTLTTGGFVDFSLPLSVTRGTAGNVKLQGWNLLPQEAQRTVSPPQDGDAVTVFAPEAAGAAVVSVVNHPTVAELEPNDPARPQPVAFPAVISGRIEAAGDVDTFAFQAAKGQRFVFRIESSTLGFPLDAVLRVTDAAGKSLANLDDTNKQRDPELAFNVAADGEYRLSVRDLYGQGSPRHAYRLVAEPVTPDFALTVANHAFVIPTGKPLEIPVTIDRRNGFAEDLQVVVVGLPESVTCQEAVVKGKDKTATLTLSAKSSPFSGSIQIVGNSSGGGALSHKATADLTGLNAKTADLWLTVQAAK